MATTGAEKNRMPGDEYLVSEFFAKMNISKNWQFRVVITTAELKKWEDAAIKCGMKKEFITNLTESINKGLRGYAVKKINLPNIWDGEKSTWMVGNYPVDWIKETENFARDISITFTDDQKLFISKLAHDLRRCIQDNRGRYYPYRVQRPIDITVRVLGPSGNLIGSFIYRKCGLFNANNLILDYGADSANELELRFVWEQLEVTFDQDLQVYGNSTGKEVSHQTNVESYYTAAAHGTYGN